MFELRESKVLSVPDSSQRAQCCSLERFSRHVIACEHCAVCLLLSCHEILQSVLWALCVQHKVLEALQPGLLRYFSAYSFVAL